MRTTLTLDDDVAVQLERLRKAREMGLKQLVNEALRRGLRDMGTAPKPRKRFRTKTWSGGELLIPNIDNVAEVLATIEGDDHK